MSLDFRREAGRILTSHPFAGGRSADLAQVMQKCTETRMDSDEVLCAEGDKGDYLYFLLQGEVRVLKRGPTGEDQELARISAPALFGHMSLIDHSARSATCVAAVPCLLLTLHRKSYAQLLTEPSARGTALRRLLLSSLTRQLEAGNARLHGLLDAPEPDKPAEEASRSSSTSPRSKKRRATSRNDSVGEEDLDSLDLLRAAGVLEGWQVDTEGIDSVESYEDEDMRRTRLDNRNRM